MSKVFVHKKTGDSYFVTGEAINATNAQDGKVMIVYPVRNTQKIYYYLDLKIRNNYKN